MTLSTWWTSFNPHPPLRAGATLNPIPWARPRTFQSSPALAGGRYCAAPPVCPPAAVSILTRPCGRALRWQLCRRYKSCLVSILTRPCGRALRVVHVGRTESLDVSILTRPCGRALRWLKKLKKRWLKFQSSPALAGGRYALKNMFRTLAESFNPHPPLRAGATVFPMSIGIDLLVSILTRPCGRALPDWYDVTKVGNLFQSSPALAGGRYDNGSMDETVAGLFQSSPALAGGRYGGNSSSG